MDPEFEEDLENLGIVVIPAELLDKASPEESEAYFQYLLHGVKRVDDWESWIKLIFPEYATKPFSQGHREFWEWVWSVELDNKPPAWVSIWSRGHAKSSSAELAIAALAARGKRKYGLYIAETQDQADDHVQNIASMLESPTIELAYPELGTPAVNKQGQSKGWRRNRIVTQSGFILDACGLDSAARGIKFEAQRPDFMCLDDIDGELDTELQTNKKIKVITQKLLPAGSPNCAILAVQNLVHENSIFARLADGRADFLRNRKVSGPIPAIENLEVIEEDGQWVIVAGTPTWPEGFPLDVCQALINEFGLTAFLAECQHQTKPPDGDIFAHIDFPSITVDLEDCPAFKRVVLWVDPAVTSSDTSDSMGIQCDALGIDGKIYRLWSWEQRATPYKAIKMAIRKALEFDCEMVGIEVNQGGETWRTVYEQAMEDMRREIAMDGGDFFRKMPRYKEVRATKEMGSKVVRAERMLVDYERGTIYHVRGTNTTLEAALKRFPRVKPFDLVDACLVAGTPVATPGGNVPIEAILPGDLVLTRQGPRRVLESGPTEFNVDVYELTTEDGRSVVGTGDHRVWTHEYGWVPLALAGGLTVSTASWVIPSKSNTMAALIVGTHTPNSAAIGSTAVPCGLEIGSLSIGRYVEESQHVFVGSRVATVRFLGNATVVYDLEVEDAHEFLADGVVVHNSFYSWSELAGRLHRRKVRIGSAARLMLNSGSPSRI